MPISIDNVAVFSAGGILGYLVRTFIDHRLAKSRTEEDRKIREFYQAAAAFRSRVLAELKGLYPVTQYWDKQTFPRLSQSITEIESAAAEFCFFVTHKSAFNGAVKEYCEYCEKISWNECVAWDFFPTMREEGEMSPREKFDHLVKNLLSFTEKK